MARAFAGSAHRAKRTFASIAIRDHLRQLQLQQSALGQMTNLLIRRSLDGLKTASVLEPLRSVASLLSMKNALTTHAH